MYDIIIIGAGPAGLTAAIYASRAGKKILVLESSSYGGGIINTLDIENYPGNMHISGFDFASNLYKQAKELGAIIKFEKAIAIKNLKLKKEVITNKDKYSTKAIIIATGLKTRKLGLEHEEELIGKGISYCATCDGNFYKNKITMVVGGGNTALEDALYLASIAKKVYLVHRRDEFRADMKTIDELKKKKNVEFILNSNVTKLIMDERLKEVEIKNNDGKTTYVSINGLFVAIGKDPVNDFYSKIIKLDKNGYVASSENCHTNLTGIFVAGDIRKKELRQLVTATSDGAIAATEAIKYLNN